MDRGNAGDVIPETRIDMEVLNDVKEKILTEPPYEHEEEREKKNNLEQAQNSSILANNNNNNIGHSDVLPEEVPDKQIQTEAPPYKVITWRCYMKNFSDPVSTNYPVLPDDISTGETIPSHPMKDTTHCPCCRTWKSFSLLLIAIGMVITVLGFIVPFYCIISREDTNEVTKDEIRVQEKTILCRLIGVLIFSTGTVIYMVKKHDHEEEPTSENSANFYVTLETDDDTNQKSAGALEMTAIQPEKESEEVEEDKNEMVNPQPQAVLQIETEK